MTGKAWIVQCQDNLIEWDYQCSADIAAVL